MELRYVGGVYAGNIKPTPFLCLTLKMLQIQPQKDIVIEFIRNEDFKYVRALGAYYMRLTGTSLDCYKYLEPLLDDYRKIRIRDRNGQYHLSHMDEFVDQLLREDRVADIQLPRLQVKIDTGFLLILAVVTQIAITVPIFENIDRILYKKLFSFLFYRSGMF